MDQPVPQRPEGAVDLSLVCPFFNEAGILRSAMRRLLAHLQSRTDRWELILVNDGSTDGSFEIAKEFAREAPGLRVLGYPHNRGRGFALRTGIAAARGRVVITTEIDLSWGERVISELAAAMDAWPEADIVVASPHLPTGGYRNVPLTPILLSRIGNRIIRASLPNSPTMCTGMTRAYRLEALRSLPLAENGKEFHLEVILKATALGMRIREIPAVLEWPSGVDGGGRGGRDRPRHQGRLIVSHSLFSLLADPVRYVWGLGLAAFLLSIAGFAWALTGFSPREDVALVVMASLGMLMLSLVLFVSGIVVRQGTMLLREAWTIQSALLRRKSTGPSPDGSGGLADRVPGDEV